MIGYNPHGYWLPDVILNLLENLLAESPRKFSITSQYYCIEEQVIETVNYYAIRFHSPPVVPALTWLTLQPYTRMDSHTLAIAPNLDALRPI